MLARLVLVVTLTQVASSPVAAQQPAELRPGDRLKVFSASSPNRASEPVFGTLRELWATSIVVTLRTGADTVISLGEVSELRRIRRKATAGSVLGATLGLLGGAAVGSQFDHSTNQPGALAAGVVAAIAAGVFGARLTGSDLIPLGAVRPRPLPGTVVRLTSSRFASTVPLVGTVRSWTVDSVVVQPDSGAAVVLRASEVQSTEWPVQRGRRTGLGAGLGVLVGGTIGTILGAAEASKCSRGGGFLSDLCGLDTAGGLLIGGAAGALVGALVGSTFRWTKWESAAETGRQVSVAPHLTPHGAGVVISVGF